MTFGNLLTANKNGWWIAIALLFTIAYVIGVSFGIAKRSPITSLGFIQTVCNGLGIRGLWLLALRLKPFPRLFWRVFLAFDVTVLALTFVFPASPHPHVPPVILWSLALLFYVPYYAGLFFYAFRSETIWQSTEAKRS